MASADRLRVYAPDKEDEGTPLHVEKEQDRAALLDKIDRLYKDAGDRLTVRWRSDIPARLLDVGICVGFLDPPSNIIVNTLVAATAPVSRSEAAAVARDVERRSLDGLVAFLTCFFPYLDDWEAVRYLLLADADPLVAARLVADDRGINISCSATDGVLKVALRCAALAAHHPRPAQLAGTWFSLFSNDGALDKAASLLGAVQRNFPRHILHSFRRLLADDDTPLPPPAVLVRPWELAARRSKVTTCQYHHSASLRRVLLDTIHGFYLQALARMPGCDLRSRYHRSLLHAGHCYGPFDPVSNIILNTIWYEAAFPPTRLQDEHDMVGTLSLLRIEARSFYGLVSFLRTCHHDLTLHQALRFLLDTNLNLHLQQPSPCGGVAQDEAFRAAAIAAWHPEPDAQVQFLSSCKAMLLPPDLSLLCDGGRQLTSEDACHLAGLLCRGSPSIGMSTKQQPDPVCLRRFYNLMGRRHEQRMAQRRISRKVKAALRRYKDQNSGPSCYQLHMICGVNERVSGLDYSEGANSKIDMCTPDGGCYHHIHANFLVTQNVGGKALGPMLFFAELSNDKNDDNDSQLLCCPVKLPLPDSEPVRCLFCEHQGIRIVHPAGEKFHGREVEFEKMILREDMYNHDLDPCLCDEGYSNSGMVRHSEYVASWVLGLEENYIYLHEDDFAIVEDDDLEDISDHD